MQAKNCGFVKSLGTCTLISAEMNAGKTKLMTSMTTTLTTVFKDTAKDTMFRADFKFPNFPFINFERKLDELISEHKIFSLATIEKYIRKIRRRFDFSRIRLS